MKSYPRRVFLRRTAGAAVFAYGCVMAAEPEQREKIPDAEIMSQCPEKIRQNRMGDGAITVRGANGAKLPGARVRIEQTRHEFLFGCNIFMFGRLRDAASQEQYNERFAQLLNYATLPFYWPQYEQERGQPAHERTEKTADWCVAHGIKCKGHPLVWDFADPRWLPQDFEEIRRLSHERVSDCIRRFAGRIDIWDVVNEPTHLGRFGTRLGEWAKSLGPVPYVRQHLETARAAGPRATLLVNDYRTDPPYYQILDQLRAGGKLMFDAIGIQSHMHREVWPLERVWRVCDTYARLGLPIHFTETTIVSGPFLGIDPNRRTNRADGGEMWGETTAELEAKQAEQAEKFYTALFAHPAVEAITWWDFSDAGAWKRAAAGWLRKDMSPKPAYDRLKELIKGRWWSKQEVKTDGNGQADIRLFYGDYQAVVSLPNGAEFKKTFEWKRRSNRRIELVI